MTCAANPHQITFDPVTQRLSFRWGRPVTYSDGTTSSGDDFSVAAVAGDRIDVIRLRDGFRGTVILAADGKTYAFGATSPDSVPSFEFPYNRCTLAGS